MNQELIKSAVSKLNPIYKGDRLHGDVAASVLAENGNLYTGVCVDTPSWGLCAERSALATMISDGCYEFKKVVAVWRDPNTQKIHVLPPCGVCREFMRNISDQNLNADVILDMDKTLKLHELIPFHAWPSAMEGE